MSIHIDTQAQTCTQTNTDVLLSSWYFLFFFRGPNFSCAAPLNLSKSNVHSVNWDGHSSPRAAAAASLWARTVTKGCPTCALHKDLIDTEDDLSCSNGWHATSLALSFSHLTQSKLMSLYTKQVSPARARRRPAMGSSGLSQQQQQWRIDTRTHRHTHKQTHVYIYDSQQWATQVSLSSGGSPQIWVCFPWFLSTSSGLRQIHLQHIFFVVFNYRF